MRALEFTFNMQYVLLLVVLKIISAQEITEGPSDVAASPFETVEFSCTADAMDVSSSRWEELAEDLSVRATHAGTITTTATSVISTYSFLASYSSFGVYRCVFDYSTGVTRTAQATLTVSPQGSVTIFRTTPSDSTMLLTCLAQGGPNNMFIFNRNGQQVANQNTFEIDTENAELGGVYECVVTNNAGQGSATDAVFIMAVITQPPISDTEAALGVDFMLTCVATAFPAPSITWLFDSVSITPTPGEIEVSETGDSSMKTSNLTIIAPSEDDAGIYTCMATNAPFPDVTVLEHAEVNFTAVSPEGSVSVTPEQTCSDRSEQVTFVCVATLGSGNSYSWEDTLTGGTIATGQTLTVMAVTSKQYTCRVENLAGSGSFTATLLVTPSILEEPKPVIVIIGYGARLSCAFDGQPNITWFHNYREVEPSHLVTIIEKTLDENKVRSTLSIRDAALQDEGIYYCSAQVDGCKPVTSTLVEVLVKKYDIPLWLWPLIRGREGEDGREGVMGRKGEAGMRGDAGSPGIPGSGIGEKGDQGKQGHAGNHGTDGEGGTDGEMGAPGEPGPPGSDIVSGGVVYTVWGLTNCPITASRVLEGLVSAPQSTDSGTAADYLCLPNSSPMFDSLANPNAQQQSGIVGVLFDMFDEPLAAVHGMAAPCAVCHTSRAAKLMLPGSATCPGNGWRTEYTGYLMSSRDNPSEQLTTEQPDSTFRTEYVCVAESAVGVAVSSSPGGDDAELVHVHLDCVMGSSLDCSENESYTAAQQLPCAICTI